MDERIPLAHIKTAEKAIARHGVRQDRIKRLAFVTAINRQLGRFVERVSWVRRFHDQEMQSFNFDARGSIGLAAIRAIVHVSHPDFNVHREYTLHIIDRQPVDFSGEGRSAANFRFPRASSTITGAKARFFVRFIRP
jgi:hypothetical protein